MIAAAAPLHDAHVTAWRAWRHGHARQFLAHLDPEAASFTFQTFDDTAAKRRELARVVHGDFDRLAETLAGLQEWRAGVFVTVNATDGAGRQAHNVERVRAVFVDLDGAPLAPVLAAGLEPHIVCESSPGRYHAYWLTDDCPLAQFERVQRALARRFGGDPSVHDLPRVMRLPGYRHFKGEAQTCKTLDGIGNSAPPYTLAAARIDDLRLVIIDPVILAVRGDSNTNGDVRRGLFPLTKLAETTGAAVIGITHFSKGTAGKNPIERVTGSLAFAAAARVVLAVARIPDDQGGGRVVLRAKNNLGPDEGGFRFDIRPVDVAGAEAVRIVWGEPIAGSALDILTAAEQQHDPDERTATDDATELVRECLTEAGGSMDRRDLWAIAKGAGISERTFARIRDRASVTVRTSGFGKDKRAVWTLAGHSCQTYPPKSKVIIGTIGDIGSNGSGPILPIMPILPTSQGTREAGSNGAPASADDYLRATRGE